MQYHVATDTYYKISNLGLGATAWQCHWSVYFNVLQIGF
jgi:ABC-type phosphate transport system permease subunit